MVVTRIDRLARSIADLAAIVREIESKGAAPKATEQPIDTGSAAGRAFLQMLGVFAEFETSIRRERQLEGIAAAKAEGVYKGRKPSIEPGDVAALKSQGFGRQRDRQTAEDWSGVEERLKPGGKPMDNTVDREAKAVAAKIVNLVVKAEDQRLTESGVDPAQSVRSS